MKNANILFRILRAVNYCAVRLPCAIKVNIQFFTKTTAETTMVEQDFLAV